MKSTLWRVAAVGVSAALLLSGCSGSGDDKTPTSTPSSTSTSSESPSADSSAADLATLKSVKVEGKAGEAPTVTFDKGLTVSANVAYVETPGTGAEIGDGMLVKFNNAIYSGATGEQAQETYSTTPTALYFTESSIDPALADALKGEKVGARVLFASPSTDQSTGEATTYVYVLDIVSADKIPTRAEGKAVTPEKGLPTVTLADNGAPSVSIPQGYTAPKDLVVQTLIEGDGPKVAEGGSVVANYTGWTLDGTQFDSSWDRGAPTTFSLTGVIKGWTDGLAGVKVGSQVLLVIPAEQAYGANPPEGSNIPADAPLVFVVDVLATY